MAYEKCNPSVAFKVRLEGAASQLRGEERDVVRFTECRYGMCS